MTSSSGQALLLQSKDYDLTRVMDHRMSRFGHFGEFWVGPTIFVQVRISTDYYLASLPLLLHCFCDRESENNLCCPITTNLPGLLSCIC